MNALDVGGIITKLLEAILALVPHGIDVGDTVRRLIDAILNLVPHEEARALLDEVAIRRANAIADVVEEAKFGPEEIP